MNRMLVSSLIVGALLALPAVAAAEEPDAPKGLAGQVRADCTWLDAAVARDPDRDDAFGVVMKVLQERCRAVGPKLDTGRVDDKDLRTLHEEIDSLRDALGPLEEPPAAEPAEEKPEEAPEKPAKAEKKRKKAADERNKAEEQPEKPGKAEVKPEEAGEPADAAPEPRGLTGTWHQEPQKRLDHFVKRTFELVEEDDGEIVGEMIEVTWRKAPMSWVQTSCDGNPIFRSVTTASVRGEVEGNELSLLRDRPRVTMCTCGQRCRAERRRRGYEFVVGAGENVLRDDDTVFVREGARLRRGGGSTAGGAGAAGQGAAGPRTVEGVWETEPFERAGETHVIRLEMKVEGDDVTGTLSERVSQDLPLASWRERFCEGNDRFEYVEVFDIHGGAGDGEVDLRFRNPRVLSCTCPSKCRTPQRRRGLSLALSPEGVALEGRSLEFHRSASDE
ncbi:MAG: hypothetical protein ACQEXJ_08165 [Myxococcota bacterium]